MNTNTRTLTVREAVNLATIIGWAQRNAFVRYLDDENRLHGGTVRSIGDERANFLNETDDVRDGFLRITLESGFERFMPMAEVVKLHVEARMMEDQR